MTSTRTLGVTAALAVLLTAWWAVVERPRMGREVLGGRVFFHLMRDDVDRVEIRKPGATVVLERSGARWRLTEPLRYDAGVGPVDALVGALVFFEVQRELPAAERAFDATPVAVSFRAQGKTHTLEVGAGARQLGKDLAYYRVDGRIVLAEETLKLLSDREVDFWREKALCPLLPDHVGRLTAEGTGLRLVCERSPRGIWMLQEPIQARGDAGVLQKLLDGLNTLAAKEFFRDDGEAPLSQFGLDPPRYRVVVESIGARERHEVLIGADCGDEPGREIYVSRADGVQVFRCDDTVTAYFALAPDDWRDRRALPFADYGWVRSVTLRGPSTDWSITRIAEDADWALTNRVRQAAVSSPRGRGGELVDTIGRILVGRYVSDGHIGAESFRVTVQVDGLPEPMILIFGEAIERGRYLARRQGVEGEADAILDIATTLPERYAEDVLVQPLVRARVRREQLLGFELRSAQGRWLLVQVAGWQVDGYPEMRIDQSLVSAALDVVLQPTAVFFEQGPVRLDDLRLTPARCTFRVGIPRGLGEFPYHELLVGSRVDPSGTVAYAKLDSDPLVFIMDPSALAALAAHLAEMCAAYDAIRDGDLGPRQ